MMTASPNVVSSGMSVPALRLRSRRRRWSAYPRTSMIGNTITAAAKGEIEV